MVHPQGSRSTSRSVHINLGKAGQSRQESTCASTDALCCTEISRWYHGQAESYLWMAWGRYQNNALDFRGICMERYDDVIRGEWSDYQLPSVISCTASFTPYVLLIWHGNWNGYLGIIKRPFKREISNCFIEKTSGLSRVSPLNLSFNWVSATQSYSAVSNFHILLCACYILCRYKLDHLILLDVAWKPNHVYLVSFWSHFWVKRRSPIPILVTCTDNIRCYIMVCAEGFTKKLVSTGSVVIAWLGWIILRTPYSYYNCTQLHTIIKWIP